MNVATIDEDAIRTAVPVDRKKWGRRRNNWFRKNRWALLFVGLPTLLATIYYGLIASDVYVSESRFVIKSPGQRSMPSVTLANLVTSGGMSSGREQTQEVLEFIRSRDALAALTKQVGLRAAYSSPETDFLSRFPQPFRDDTFENLYRYYRGMVDAEVDSETGVAVLKVSAFAATDSRKINGKLLQLSEGLVNRLNGRAEGRAITEAQRRVQEAENRVRSARVSLSAYRDKEEVIDPSKQAVGVLEISNEFEAQQAGLRAQLELMQRVAPLHPAIPALKSRVAALQRAAATQSNRAVGSPKALASKLATYEKLLVEQEFATQMLTAANTALEQARTEAQKQQYYLERVVEPSLPDDPLLPNRLKLVLIIFASSLCLYFVGWMLVVGILEHKPED